MCGPSGAEKNISGEQQDFYSQLMSSYSQNFVNQGNILKALTNQLTPIVQAGPSQTGFSAGEAADLKGSAINNNAAAYKNAATVVGEGRAMAGGGNDFLPSGVDKQVQGQIASEAAGNLANTESNINLANYAQGRQNWSQALSGLGGVASEYSPASYAGAATSAGNSAFGSAQTIAQQQAQEEQAIAGGIIGAGGAALSGGLTAMAPASSAFNQSGNGFLNFLGNLGG